MSAQLQVLITGCSDGGIGASLALRLANNVDPPCHVYATLRSPSKAASLANHPNITVLPLDVVSPASISELAATLSSKAVKLDIVICNAGQSHPGPLLDIEVEEAQKTYDTNVWGYLRVVQALVPDMCRRGEGGLVVTISSIAAILPTPWSGTYSSSKSALTAMAETLGMELELFGIQSLIVKPGAVLSNIASTSTSRLPRSLSAPTPEATSLYVPFLPAILTRMAISQTAPSAITSTTAADLITRRIFLDYKPAGAPVGWMEWLRARTGWAMGADRKKRRWRGGVFLFQRFAWLFYWLDLLVPREVAMRFVGGVVAKHNPGDKKKN